MSLLNSRFLSEPEVHTNRGLRISSNQIGLRQIEAAHLVTDPYFLSHDSIKKRLPLFKEKVVEQSPVFRFVRHTMI